MGATSDESITFATEVWDQMKNVFNDCFDAMNALLNEIKNRTAAIINDIRNILIEVAQTAWEGTGNVAQALWRGFSWIANTILIPVVITGVNAVGYVLDKFLFGFPALRPYLHDGLLASDIPQSWRNFLSNNTGWDIYENMGPVLDNTFGILGFGVGTLNILNHLTTSIYKNFVNSSHVLGTNGVFGQQGLIEDSRETPVKIVCGIFTAPILVIPLFVTNTVDAICALTKNFFESFGYNIARTFNLLGEDGIFGPRKSIDDTRSMPAQIVYGILSAPFVAVLSVVTNAVDAACSFMKNFSQSFYNNLRPIFNILGEYGVMGPHRPYEDNRKMPAKIAYGVLSAPFVVVAAAVTNIFDCVCAYFKNYETTIKIPAIIATGVVGGTLLAIPTFLTRKTIKGLYNCGVRPFVDCAKGNEFSGRHMLNGIANVLTCGTFAAVKKVFKACTGYSSRFGFPTSGNNNGMNSFDDIQNKFKQAIELASNGNFPDVEDRQGKCRFLTRMFYGMHHKIEEILKTFHDAFLGYAKELTQINTERVPVAYNMNSFFQSDKYIQAKRSIQLREGEESYIDKVESYLRRPTLSRSEDYLPL